MILYWYVFNALILKLWLQAASTTGTSGPVAILDVGSPNRPQLHVIKAIGEGLTLVYRDI